MNLFPSTRFADIDRIFDRFFAPASSASEGENFFAPKVDIKQKKDRYKIEAELPGVKKEDLTVELNKGVLSISATMSSESEEKDDERIIRQERVYGSFARSFYVGEDVNAEKLQAEFKNGVLHIELPFTESKKPDPVKVAIK